MCEVIYGFLLTVLVYSYTCNHAYVLFRKCFCSLPLIGLIEISCALTLAITRCKHLSHRNVCLCTVRYSCHNKLGLGKARSLFRKLRCHCAMLCLVAQSCPTLCGPMDCSPPGSSVHGDSPGKNIGVSCHALFQGIFPTQGLNPSLPHCWQTLRSCSDSLQVHVLQHARLPCPSPIPGACSNSCPSSRWCQPTTSSSVPFSSCLQSFPALGSFLMSQFFTSGGQSTGASASASA